MMHAPLPLTRGTLLYTVLLFVVISTSQGNARNLRGKSIEASAGGPTTLTGWPSIEAPATPTKQEREQFLRENLEPQINRWRSHNLTTRVLEDFAKELVASPQGKRVTLLILVVLRNNTLTAYEYMAGWRMFYRRFETLQDVIRESGLTFPDTAFIFNQADQTVCINGSRCAAPVLSTYGHKDDPDLLLPVTNHEYKLQNSPWQHKLPVAFGRAGHNYQTKDYPDGMSTRAHLAVGSMKHPDKLDFGLSNLCFPPTQQNLVTKLGLEKAQYVAMEDHPHWRYLVLADGVTASPRLDKLLLMNSVTLKEEGSPYTLFFDRSIKPWVHYVPFQSGPRAVPTLLGAVELLRANDTFAQQVSQAGQTFASKFLLPPGRAWYIQQLLLAYNGLFGEGVMEAWVAGQGPTKLAAELRDLKQKTKKPPA